MPLLDSFCVDHTMMNAPGVRFAKKMKTPKGDDISVFDLRFCKPNIDILPPKGMHTLEHLFAGFMRDHLNSSSVEIIDISPMGCRTGFYMSVIGSPSQDDIIQAWTESMRDVIKVKTQNDIPELNKFQCGSYEMHSLDEAKNIAKNILDAQICIINNEDIKLDLDKIK